MTPMQGSDLIARVLHATFQEKLLAEQFGPEVERSEIVRGLRKLAVGLRSRLKEQSNDIMAHAAIVCSEGQQTE